MFSVVGYVAIKLLLTEMYEPYQGWEAESNDAGGSCMQVQTIRGSYRKNMLFAKEETII